ncbi:MAG: hypothetical protein HY980_02165 [Candidatus Magasanikbacteria bacterium]|nr:hypothetical protein [Candidatus Magasanikbacteria bacterium]
MYLKWHEQTITDFSASNVNSLYNRGYLFTRKGRGVMNQTRSIRIDFDRFKLTSENRRIMRKISDFRFQISDLPLQNYHWSIGKMAKDFYTTKFDKGIFSANKIKELLTTKHNFNMLLKYSDIKILDIGYCVCYQNKEILHYSYPFYRISNISNIQYPNIGLGMMLKAIVYAKDNGKKYVYLGSAQRPTDTYKLQFEGLEWFDGKEWSEDLEGLKRVLGDRER